MGVCAGCVGDMFPDARAIPAGNEYAARFGVWVDGRSVNGVREEPLSDGGVSARWSRVGFDSLCGEGVFWRLVLVSESAIMLQMLDCALRGFAVLVGSVSFVVDGCLKIAGLIGRSTFEIHVLELVEVC